MSTPTTLRKGRTVLVSSDTCPRCVHLISQHDDSPPRCNGIAPGYSASLPGGRCACTPQDVHDLKPG